MKNPNALHIQINQPCHADWNKMMPAKNGRHCESCAKIVIDFSIMSDHEIVAYFKQSKTSTCGHFRADQLNRPLEIHAPKPVSVLPYRWLVAASFASLFSLSILDTKAVVPLFALPPKTSEEKMHGGVRYISPIYPEYTEFRGVVTTNGKPLSRVSIYLVATKVYFYTKSDGSFSFRMKTADYRKNGLVSFSKSGFEVLHMHLKVVLNQPNIEMISTSNPPELSYVDEKIVTPIIDTSTIETTDTISIVYGSELCSVNGEDGMLQPSEVFEIVYREPLIRQVAGATGIVTEIPKRSFGIPPGGGGIRYPEPTEPDFLARSWSAIENIFRSKSAK
jgi:hypothetical protein